MNEQEKENLIVRFRRVIEKEITKYRRDFVNHPSGEEFVLCWAEAVVAASPQIITPRKPGRPKKPKVVEVQVN